MKGLLLAALLCLAARMGYDEYQKQAALSVIAQESQKPKPASNSIAEATPSGMSLCDGRTLCVQMSSCEEAKFFMKHCPNTQMDNNNDGIPCQREWCN